MPDILSPIPSRAVFFDKDGVLNPDRGVHGFTAFTDFYPYVPAVIQRVRGLGYKTFIVTNQPIVGRGLITENQLCELFTELFHKISAACPDAVFDGYQYCPHHPHADIIEYRADCTCRKPHPGMITDLAHAHCVNTQNSFMIGDRSSDITAGRLAGCTTIQCLTGCENEPPIISSLSAKPMPADFTISDLNELPELLKSLTVQ